MSNLAIGLSCRNFNRHNCCPHYFNTKAGIRITRSPFLAPMAERNFQMGPFTTHGCRRGLRLLRNDGEVLRATVQELQERCVRYYNVHPGAAPVPNRSGIAVEALGAGAMVAMALGLPLALLIASIISTGLETDTIAISQAPHCGTYAYTAGFGRSSTFVEFEHRAESESGLYADECYGDSSLIKDCNKFYNQTISYSSKDAADCLFDGKVCCGTNDSIMFTTKLSLDLFSKSTLVIRFCLAKP
ncbi:hypothetical protein BGZ57DRAFT_101264 [Hyaloscypha finlandica]|nr:hypothetical protein BGZ57DRAFT_101264 [Hyaloscypha finlandica]